MDQIAAALARTPLHDLNIRLGAKFAPFAGCELPVQFPAGILAEHAAAREGAALFDVSHMGQIVLRPRSGEVAAAARALERLVPQDIVGLGPDRQRYAFFTNAQGGILDDLMVARRADHLFLVVNAANAAADAAHLEALTADACRVEVLDRALLALQGPRAEAVLAACGADLSATRFMDAADADLAGASCWLTRSGYTGEDGFEISVPREAAEAVAQALLDAGAQPAGLGARDSLRLEAGLCLHGSDIDAGVTPVEAGLAWAIQKVRRNGGERQGGFPGAARILQELAEGPRRLRVGLRPEGRAPMRAGTILYSSETAEAPCGGVVSGGFGPTLGAPVAMAYLPAGLSAPGTQLWGDVRGKRLPAAVAPMPFVPHRYKR